MQTEILPGGTRVFINTEHRFGTDALLLAEFCRWHAKDAFCDFGSGCGILALALRDKGLLGNGFAVEQNADACALVEKSIVENQISNLTVCQTDLRTWRIPRLADLVVSNPPYFNTGPASPKEERASARHELTLELSDLCVAARRALKDGGSFCMCYPPHRLAQLFAAMQQNDLAPKRLQLVRAAAQRPPWLALIDARKHGGVGLDILPDYILPAGKPLKY